MIKIKAELPMFETSFRKYDYERFKEELCCVAEVVIDLAKRVYNTDSPHEAMQCLVDDTVKKNQDEFILRNDEALKQKE